MRVKLPHPFVLLLYAVLVAVALTWIVPAGQYDRRADATVGRDVVVPGSYHRVAQAPVGVMGALMAVPRGVVDGASVIICILVVGGAFALLDATGALGRLVGALVGRTRRPRIVVALVIIGFAIMGNLENMHEEIIALAPVLVVLSRGLGFGAVTALGMSVGAAVVGSAFGPTNPFQTGIALKFAEMPALSQPALRFGLFAVAVAVWIAWTLAMTSRDDERPEVTAPDSAAPTWRDYLMLAIVLVPFGPYVYGILNLNFGFDELTGFFVVAGFAIGLISGLSLTETATSFLKAMEGMLAAGMYVGVARGISVTLNDGQILDTILYSLATPLSRAPGILAGFLMVPMHAILHVPVVSVSGQAGLTMPVMAPLADLVGISRDAAVIAYQTGAGLMDMITPTNGALLAMLAGAKVTYGRWMQFAIPGALLVSVVGFVGIWLAG